jgi:hypothetical protein
MIFGWVGLLAVVLGELFHLLFSVNLTLSGASSAAPVIFLTSFIVLAFQPAEIDILEDVVNSSAGWVAGATLTGAFGGWSAVLVGFGPFFPYSLRLTVQSGIAIGVAFVVVFMLRMQGIDRVTRATRTTEYQFRPLILSIIGLAWLGLGSAVSILGQDLDLVPSSSLELYVPSLIKAVLIVLRDYHLAIETGIGAVMLLVLAVMHRDILRRVRNLTEIQSRLH